MWPSTVVSGLKLHVDGNLSEQSSPLAESLIFLLFTFILSVHLVYSQLKFIRSLSLSPEFNANAGVGLSV
jgi:hypothetical protein